MFLVTEVDTPSKLLVTLNDAFGSVGTLEIDTSRMKLTSTVGSPSVLRYVNKLLELATTTHAENHLVQLLKKSIGSSTELSLHNNHFGEFVYNFEVDDDDVHVINLDPAWWTTPIVKPKSSETASVPVDSEGTEAVAGKKRKRPSEDQ